MDVIKIGGIDESTKLYRYIGLNQFMSFVETRATILRQVKQWHDTWEIPFRYVAVEDSGITTWHDDTIYDEVYAQCWSLNAESDALWRIYSQNNEGLMIATTAKRFHLLAGIKCAVLAPVIYFDDADTGRDRVYDQYGDSPIFGAFLKRMAFEHEHEVRFAMLNREDWLGHVCEDSTHIKIDLDPIDFIEEIVIDPRASDWYVETIQHYCKRAGFSIPPVKSSLYSPMAVKLPTWVIEVPQESQPEQ